MDETIASLGNPPQPAKKRTRASVACNFCRIKRSKCDAATVGTPCSNCSKNGLGCELPQEGKRRQRSSSRVQVEALTERVKVLESLLTLSTKSSNSISPTSQSISNHPPGFSSLAKPLDMATLTALPYQLSEDNEPDMSLTEQFSLGIEDSCALDDFHPGSISNDSMFEWQLDDIHQSTSVMEVPLPTSLVDPLSVQTDRTVLDDQAPRAREASFKDDRSTSVAKSLSSADSPRSTRSSLPESVIDHLLDMYFQHYQTILQIVDEDKFRRCRADKVEQRPALRESLVLAMLAAGARFSPNPTLVKHYAAHSGDSVFVRRSKALLESEIGQADIMTVQALLILGELETSAGNEMTGCMYSGLVSRLVFDLGLDPASSQEMNLPESEVNVRHWILWNASVQDKYWAQSMNRPLTIKNTELHLSRMIAKFSQQTTVADTLSTENIIQESLFDLLELTREAQDVLIDFKYSIESYTIHSRMNSRLDQWLRNQPQAVRNGSTSSNTNHFVFVLLMQFHMTKVQLHHPFAFHRPQSTGPDTTPAQLTMGSIASHCQAVGSASAIKVAKLFATFRQKHDIRHLQCSGTQYAAVATRFLIKYIPLLQTDEVVEPEAHLRSLIRTLEDMARTFKPALKPLCEAKAALEAWEARTNGGQLTQAYPAPRTRPTLGGLDMSPHGLFPINSELEGSPNNDNGTHLNHAAHISFEQEGPGSRFQLPKKTRSRTISQDSGACTSIDGWENLMS